MRSPVTTRARTAKPRKARVKGDVVKPDYTLRLMELMGPSAAADAIGVSPGTLHKGRNADAISKHFEVAARGIWMEKGYSATEAPAPAAQPPRTADLGSAVAAPTAEGLTLMLVQVPNKSAAMLLRTAEMLGATVVVQD